MTIRRDSLFISSVLFTIALLCLVPAGLRAAVAGHDKVALRALDPAIQSEVETMGDLGTASLAIISIGLIVTWAGYVNRVRWTWFVMFIIVWVWAFPLLVLPLLQNTLTLGWAEWLYSAIYQRGSPRDWAEVVLIFVLLVIALLLPVKSFVFVGESPELIRPASPRRIGASVAIILVAVIAALGWIHTRSYVLTPSELRLGQPDLITPPPPPEWPPIQNPGGGPRRN